MKTNTRKLTLTAALALSAFSAHAADRPLRETIVKGTTLVFNENFEIPKGSDGGIVFARGRMNVVTAEQRKLMPKLVTLGEQFKKYSRPDGSMTDEGMRKLKEISASKEFRAVALELLEFTKSDAGKRIADDVKAGTVCILSPLEGIRATIREQGAKIVAGKTRLAIDHVSLESESAATLAFTSKSFGNMTCIGNTHQGYFELAHDIVADAFGGKVSIEGAPGAAQAASRSDTRRIVGNGDSGAAKAAVALSDSERRVVSAGADSAVTYNGGRQQLVRGGAEIRDYAVSRGIPASAVDTFLSLSQKSGGRLGVAGSRADLAPTINDLLAVMKGRITSAQDLELVFVLDYSGSMGDVIEAVIRNLDQLTQSLQAVRDSGRNVHIGIITFGRPEAVFLQLQLTDNLGQVRQRLAQLLANYERDQSSIEPGEASYHGLAGAVTSINWASDNRNVLLITDEPSYEKETGDLGYMNAVEAGLKRNGVQVVVYPILIKQGY